MLQTEFGLLKLGNQEVSRQKYPYFFSQWIDLCGAEFWGGWSLQESEVLKATVCFDL